VVNHTDQRHEVQAGIRSSEAGQGDGNNLNFQACQCLTELGQPRGVGAKTLADGEGMVIEPQQVAAFRCCLAVEGVQERDASPGKAARHGCLLAAAQDLAHSQDDGSGSGDNRRVVNKDGVCQVGRGFVLVQHLGACLDEHGHKRVVLLASDVEVGSAGIVPGHWIGRAESLVGSANDHAAQCIDHTLAAVGLWHELMSLSREVRGWPVIGLAAVRCQNLPRDAASAMVEMVAGALWCLRRGQVQVAQQTVDVTQGEAHHIRIAAADARDGPELRILNGVGARLVQRVAGGNIGRDFLVGVVPHDNAALDKLDPGFACGRVEQRDPAVHGVRVPSELAQHQHGVLPVDWLSENLAAKGDGGVGSEDQLAISPWQQSLRLGTREPQDHIESGL